MHKSILQLSFLIIVLFASNKALSFVQVNSVTENNPPFNDCSNAYLNVSGDLGGANYAFAGATVITVGFNITVNIEYTVGGITLPAIMAFTQVVDLGFLPVGVYNITTNGVLNGAIGNSVMTASTVTSCCNANPAFASNGTNFCVGESVLLTNSSTGTTSQIWYQNNVAVGTSFDLSTTAGTPGSYVYKLVVTNGICVDSTEYMINVFDPPVITSVMPSSQSVCTGESITFTGSATGAFSYSWYKDNVFAGSGNSFTTTASGVGMHTYMLITLSACADTMETTVEFLAPPTFNSFSVADDSLCLGETASFTSATVGATSETWYENGTMIGSGSILDVTPGTAGSYSYNLTVTDGVCTDSMVQLVQIFDLPMVYLGADTNSCSGPIILDAGAGFDSYEWQDLSVNQTLVADSGTYYVTVADLNGCEAIDSIEVTTCALINELNHDWIKVSPNPTSSSVTFDLGKVFLIIDIQIVNMNGELVLNPQYNNENLIQLDMSNLSDGAYFIQFEIEGIASVVKVIKR